MQLGQASAKELQGEEVASFWGDTALVLVLKKILLFMQCKLKKKSVKREFPVGDHMLVLHPLSSSSLQAKFCGPYVIDKQLSEMDYVAGTSERRQKSVSREHAEALFHLQ